jgi:hypothetical protein
MEQSLTELFDELVELATWLDNECPTVAPPLEPYDTGDLSLSFCENLRSRLDRIKELKSKVQIESHNQN